MNSLWPYEFYQSVLAGHPPVNGYRTLFEADMVPSKAKGFICNIHVPLFLFFVLIVKLAEHFIELFGYRETRMAGVPQKTSTLIAQAKADDSGAQRRAGARHMQFMYGSELPNIAKTYLAMRIF